jgi:Protein of unknown function (DUF2924)
MAESIVMQIAALKNMTVGQLREVYAEKFGEPSSSRNKPWLFKRIAWRIQELAEGGLSERAKKRAAELANDADLRLRPPKGHKAPETGPKRDPRLPAAGTELKREFNGKAHVVAVAADGFAYKGKPYRSLSAIAKQITGTQWNGFLFFGLTAKEAR